MSLRKNLPETVRNNKEKDSRRRQILFGSAAVIWMAVIFFFSARPDTLSDMDSGTITNLIAGILHPSYSSWDTGPQLAMLESLDRIVRKTAHFTEYAILCFLYSNTFLLKKKGIAAAAALSILYAVSDEFHQSFVSGRAAMVGDVCIDAAGALAAALLLAAVSFRKRK